MVLLPKGKGVGDLVPRMRSRLHDTPVLLPTWGWPPDENTVPPDDPEYDIEKTSRLNDAAPPDWSWRTTPLLDQRANGDRPKPIQALEIDADQIDRDLAGNSTVIDGYQAIAARHQHALGHLRNARQILFRGNFAVVRFNQLDGGEVEAVHEVYTAFTDPDQPADLEPKPEPYMVQVASLGPLAEDPPTRLRTTAIEPRRPDPRGHRWLTRRSSRSSSPRSSRLPRVHRRRARRGARPDSGASATSAATRARRWASSSSRRHRSTRSRPTATRSTPSAEADAAVSPTSCRRSSTLSPATSRPWVDEGSRSPPPTSSSSRSIDLMATNYVRLRWPRFFLIMQSVATLDELTSTYGAGSNSAWRASGRR